LTPYNDFLKVKKKLSALGSVHVPTNNSSSNSSLSYGIGTAPLHYICYAFEPLEVRSLCVSSTLL
jgi:hypothetical protein